MDLVNVFVCFIVIIYLYPKCVLLLPGESQSGLEFGWQVTVSTGQHPTQLKQKKVWCSDIWITSWKSLTPIIVRGAAN